MDNTNCVFNDQKIRMGFSLVELFVVIAIIGILIGMLLPATRRVGDAARRTQCLNNLRQLGLANWNYEDANSKFPSAVFIQSTGAIGENPNGLSGFVSLLPFIEQGNLYDQISNDATIDGIDYTPFPAPWTQGYGPWQNEISLLICPTSLREDTEFGQTNYAFSIGDQARNIDDPKRLRGVFGGTLQCTFDRIVDGASNTILFAEIGNQYDRNIIGRYAVNQPASLLENPASCFDLVDPDNETVYRSKIRLGSIGRGSNWSDGLAGSGMVNMILPPGSPSAAVMGTRGVDGLYSAGSEHAGTTGVVLCDGSTHSVDNTIDVGDSSHPALTEQQINDRIESPYGAWGALGSIDGEEIVNVMDY